MVDELYQSCLIKKTTDILKHTFHPLREFYYVAKSGCRYLSERARTILQYFLSTSTR